MIIAVSGEFGDGISKFVWFHVERERILEREVINAAPGGSDSLIRQLIGLNVDLLISGKLPQKLVMALHEAGIALISGINDDSDRTLKAYLDGTLQF